MRGRSSGKTGPPATTASPWYAGGLKPPCTLAANRARVHTKSESEIGTTSEMSRSCALAVLSWLPAVAAFTGPATRHGVCTRPAACTQPPPRLAADHPAVAGWPDKYTGTAGGPGPRVLHDAFAVLRRPQSQKLVIELDVKNWPTWTTAGNDRWVENVTRKDKEMPYGEALGSGSGSGLGSGSGSGSG